MTRNTWWLVGAMVLAACGPAGTLTGKVTVEGGSAGGIAVIVYGPQSAATVTSDDGSFSVGSLPDGKYVVKATLRGAEVEEQSAAATIAQGKTSEEPSLNFRLSTAKITGKVFFADGAGAQDLTVTAVGPETRGARTVADGSFTFENLKSGAYVVSVEAADTKEGRVSVGVNASGTVSAGELRLTPVGRIGGSVSFSGAAVSGASVMLTGTSVMAVTDATGRFSLEGVPTGPQALLARVGTAPFFRSATVMVTVVRGANPDAMLTLTDDPPPTGTVTGVITFRGSRSPRDISITAPGSGVTVNAAANGTYSLTLPVGVWDIIASAPSHPSSTLARVSVNAGQVQALPGRELSWYRPLWSSTSSISGLLGLTVPALTDTHNWVLYSFSDATTHLALVNVQSFDFREVAVGATSNLRVSRTGKYAGWIVNSTVFVYEIATGTITTFPDYQNAPSGFEFSSDESVLFITRAGPFLQRVSIANPSMSVRFPAMTAATQILSQSVDRWFVRETTDVRLVTPSADVAQVFTQVSSLSVTPTAWALTNCGATCQLRLLAPNATSSVQDTAVNPAPGSLSPFTSSTLASPADYPCFTMSGTSSFCARASDGTHTALVAVPVNFRLNEAADRVIFTFVSGGNQVVREEAFPPQMSTTNLGANTTGWTTAWVSPTRAVAYETVGATRTLHVVTGGVAASNPDVSGTQPIRVAGSLVLFPEASTSTWKFFLANGATKSLNVPTTIALVGAAARGVGTGPITKYGAVSFDQATTTVIDENTGTVKVGLFGSFVVSNSALRSGASEFLVVNRGASGTAAFAVFNNLSLLEPFDGQINPLVQLGNSNLFVFLGLSADGRTLYTGSFAP